MSEMSESIKDIAEKASQSSVFTTEANENAILVSFSLIPL